MSLVIALLILYIVGVVTTFIYLIKVYDNIGIGDSYFIEYGAFLFISSMWVLILISCALMWLITISTNNTTL